MKHPEIIVQIPEPCHEDWNKMTPTEKGKFCKLCTKEVVDFSAKSDEEIINHLTKHKNLCGRFHTSQLDRKLIADRKKRNHWLSYAASLLLPMALFSQEKSQKIGKPLKIEKVDTSKYTSLHISSLERKNVIQKESINVRGIVTNETGDPLVNASLTVKGTRTSVTTDPNGMYSFVVNVDDIIKVSIPFYETIEIKITKEKRAYNLILKSYPQDELSTVLGGAVGGINVCYSSNNSNDRFYRPYVVTKKMKELKKRTENYFAFQRKKWLEKRARRRAERAKRKAQKNTSNK